MSDENSGDGCGCQGCLIIVLLLLILLAILGVIRCDGQNPTTQRTNMEATR